MILCNPSLLLGRSTYPVQAGGVGEGKAWILTVAPEHGSQKRHLTPACAVAKAGNQAVASYTLAREASLHVSVAKAKVTWSVRLLLLCNKLSQTQ